MSYLRLRDYITTIQEVNLLQIINSETALRLDTERIAEAEVKSYLVQKYDVSAEFLDTAAWSPSKVYKAYALVELNFTDYDPLKIYQINELINFTNGKCYIATAITVAGENPTTTPGKWTLLGTKFDLFNIVPPQAQFDYKAYYKTGNLIFFKDKVHTALLDTPVLSHYTALQYGRSNNLPLPNVFPDDAIYGAQYWGTGSAFTVSAGTLPTNAAWTLGDNRSSQLVQKTVDICLYHLHSRIAPRNIPQLRIDRYNAAIDWLKDAAHGLVTADIPLLQPKKTGALRVGSDVKRTNDY